MRGPSLQSRNLLRVRILTLKTPLAVGLSVWLAGKRRRGPLIVPALVDTVAVFCYLLETMTAFKYGIVYVFSA